jgi:predicted transcriptional regulator YdeE
METYQLKTDIKTVCVSADSFPDGIPEAFERLRSLLPSPAGERKLYGISRPDQTGKIWYKAGAEQRAEEDAGLPGLDSFVIPKGSYASILIPNYADDVQQIGKVFRQLLSNPDIDENGFCLEVYEGEKDVRCLVKLAETNTTARLTQTR